LNRPKQLWLLAGGNGAGKSTFYRTQLEPLGMPFVNADILARQLYPDDPEQHSYQAAGIAEEIRSQLIKDGRSFCFETVFSHPSKIDFIAQAKTMGYEIVLVFIHLNSLALNNARVTQRVSEGGHNVPEEKVNARIPRTLANITKSLPLCDHVYLLDNSRSDNPFRRVAEIHDGKTEIQQSPIPEWAIMMMSDYLK